MIGFHVQIARPELVLANDVIVILVQLLEDAPDPKVSTRLGRAQAFAWRGNLNMEFGPLCGWLYREASEGSSHAPKSVWCGSMFSYEGHTS